MGISPFKKICIYSAALLLFSTFYGCTIKYSFTGASVSLDVKTATIQYFQNRAPLVNPRLAQMLTEKLKDKILSQTHLKIVDREGDVNITGSIDNYGTQPMAVQGGDNVRASLNRLTVTVKVTFTNSKDSQYDFENSSFSRYKDYDSNMSVQSAEDQYLEKEIVDLLVEDIFNKAFVNW